MINLLVLLSIMYADIKGEVVNPGVYEINNNNIYEVINMAGGLSKESYITNINLSKKVTDEMIIYIPSIKDKPLLCPPCPVKECMQEETTTKIISTTIPRTTTKIISTTIPKITNEITTTKKLIININTASYEELLLLNGIGEKTALNIISYRVDNHFNTIEDIKNIKGIGELVFVKIKDYITV